MFHKKYYQILSICLITPRVLGKENVTCVFVKNLVNIGKKLEALLGDFNAIVSLVGMNLVYVRM